MPDGGPPHGADDTDWLLYELGGIHRAQVLSTLAALGVPDHLQQHGPAPLHDLMDAAGSFQEGFESLVRAAAGLGVLREEPPGTFALTRRGELLCSSQLGDFAAFLGSHAQWAPWARFRDALRDDTCRTAFEHALGEPMYEYLAGHEQLAREYDRAIDAFTRHAARALRGTLDLSGAQLLVDVGGGRGALLRELLDEAPHARGVLFDLPHVIAALGDDLPARVTATAGSFVREVPAGGDVYLLKHILHNWTDGVAATILHRCVAARREGGRIVVIDAVLHADNRPDLARMLDLEMRILCGGRERRRPEMRRLLQAVGLRVVKEESLGGGAWLFVAQ